jgi:hypothetical protein
METEQPKNFFFLRPSVIHGKAHFTNKIEDVETQQVIADRAFQLSQMATQYKP